MFTVFGRGIKKAEVKLAEVITGISGSMTFVYFHVVAFVLFFIFKPFQVEVFNILLSLEAVFLATFILVAQNRAAELAEEREREDEEQEEEIEEELEDIQEDFDSLRKDLEDMRGLLGKLEGHLAQRGMTPSPSEPEKVRKPEPKKEKVAV